NLSPNIIVVKCSNATIIANDDSPLLFFCASEENSCSLFVLDTTTLETLSLKLPRPVNDSRTKYRYNIVGVHGGEITVKRTKGEQWVRLYYSNQLTVEICKAKFPEALKNLERASVERDRIGSVQEKRRRGGKEKERKEEDEERRFEELQETMKKSISEQVRNKMYSMIDEIRLRMDALERENTKLKDQVAESNGKYKKLLMMV
ncbi:hypothetical protein PFISCL1PPCAC_9172, partial [Pristionchus fissidentatus]